MAPKSILYYKEVGHSQEGAKEVVDLFDGKGVFDGPKPTRLLKRLIRLANTNTADMILDFFAGSASTFDAALQMNAEDNSNLRIIGVQLPEPVDTDSPAGKAGFKTIADISRKRIELAGEKIKKDYAEQLAKRDTPLDVGYRAYSLTDTNFAKWHESSATGEDTLAQHLFELSESADEHASELALLTEVLLKQGYSLTESVRKESVSGLAVWSVADGLVLAYMNEDVKPTLEQLRALANREPERLIVLEDAFHGDDELKTNLVQAAKTRHVELWTA
jgi:adenine-specific DNA-methyltransferase